MSQEQNKRIHLDQMYQEIIRDHHKDPRNFGSLEKPDLREEGYNPVCGDRIVIELTIDPEKKMIKKSAFSGEGCSICMASASILMQETENRLISESKALIEDFRKVMQSEEIPESIEGDLEALTGVRKFPVRIKCALLPWTTLKKALDGLEND